MTIYLKDICGMTVDEIAIAHSELLMYAESAITYSAEAGRAIVGGHGQEYRTLEFDANTSRMYAHRFHADMIYSRELKHSNHVVII